MCEIAQEKEQKKNIQEQATRQQEERLKTDQYTVHKLDAQNYYEQVRDLSDKRHNYLRNHVRSAVIDKLGRDRYKAFDALRIKEAPEEQKGKVVLHHALGSRYALNGEDVIEFDIAGSGFRYPRMEHKEMTAWKDTDEYRDQDIKVSWYNKIRPFTWLPKVKTKKHIEELNRNRQETNRKIESIYGERVETKVNGKKLGHLRKKESINDKDATKTRFYLRGPNAVNIGKYSEDHLEEYIFELGKETLENKLERWERLDKAEIEKEKPVHIMVQGHSRGGVASVLGAMRLKRWIADRHPRLLNKVRFDLIQYDPVAGGPENFGMNAEVDHDPADEKLKTKDPRYMSLGQEANTTVIYSMHTDHSAFFTPQRVKNPKRIILTMADHGVNLNQTDNSQEGDTRRITYLAEKNGKVEAFRSSGLSELEEGVYLCDDQNNLIRLKSLEEYDALAKPLLKGAHLQGSRHEVVRDSVKAWFQSNGEQITEEDFAKDQKQYSVKREEKTKEQPFVGRRKTKEELEAESYIPPKEMEGALREKEKLDKMSKASPEEKAAYDKRNSKYLTAKRSGIKAYINRLYKQKGGFIDRSKKEYLDLLADFSYYKEKEAAGLPDDKRAEKISKIIEKIKVNPYFSSADRFMPGYLKGTLFAGTDRKIRELVYPFEKEPVQKGQDAPKWDKEVTSLFSQLVGVIQDEHYDTNVGGVVSDEIWSRIRTFDNEDSATYRQFRSAVLMVKNLAKRLREGEASDRQPDTARLMEAMARLSETANAFYDTHRGHQYTEKGKNRRKACDMVREITKEFYDRLDIAMGGTGYGNMVTRKHPKQTGLKERTLSQSKMEELVGVYGKWKKHFSMQEGLERTKLRDRAKLFEPYERFIDMYRDTHRVKEWPKEIEEVMREADILRVQNRVHESFERETGSVGDPLLALTKKHAKKIKAQGFGDQSALPDEKGLDAKLSPEQVKALSAIDQWFLRNYNNGGLVGSLINVRNHHGEIVSELFSKTKRERLFIYYLIETRQRKNPGIFDVFNSQSYIPDLNRFKDRMLASKFKIMSHIMGGYTYMGKVTEALQVNEDYRGLIKDIARLDAGVSEVKGKELSELKKKKEEYRTYTLARLSQSTKAFRDEAIRVGKLGRKATEEDKAALAARQQSFLKDLSELVQADDAVGEAINNSYYSAKDTNLTDLSDNTDTYTKAASAAASNVHLVVNGVNLYGASVKEGVNIIKGRGYNPTFWKLKENSLMQPSTYGSTVTAGTIASLGSLLGVCYGVYNLVTNWDTMHGFDRGAAVAGILQSAGTYASTALTTAETAEDLAKGLEAMTSTLTKTIGVTVAGLKAGTDLYTTVSGQLDCKNADKASSLLKDRIHSRYLKQLKAQVRTEEEEAKETAEQKAEREQSFQKARFDRNMLVLSEQISDRKRSFAGAQTAASFMTVAGLTVPVAGTIVSGAGTVMSLVVGMLSGMKLTDIRNSMFDQYFQFDSFLKDALADMEKRGQSVHDEEQFKLRMRRVLAACAGYADVISACDQIAKKYADQICRGLFSEDENRVEGQEREAYIELVKSFGLPYDEKKKIPGPALLARRMNGK